MSEYMEKFAVSRLVGSPPGYVGYDEGGQLTEAVRRRPYSIILLDEIEKAHPDVFDILLQILDEGRLTDSKGRTVDFKNTIIIGTSNIGASKITQYFSIKDKSKDWEVLKEQLNEELKKKFKPEFLNRIDEVIVFKSLELDQIKEIVKIQLKEVEQLVNAQDLEISFDEKVIDYLAQKGYQPEYGARPIKRIIQKEIENPLADYLLNQNEQESSLKLVLEQGVIKIMP